MKNKRRHHHHASSKPYERKKSFWRSLTDTLKMVVTPSWLSDIVRNVTGSTKTDKVAYGDDVNNVLTEVSQQKSTLSAVGQFPDDAGQSILSVSSCALTPQLQASNNGVVMSLKNEATNGCHPNLPFHIEKPFEIQDSTGVTENGVDEEEPEDIIGLPSVRLNRSIRTATCTFDYNSRNLTEKPAVQSNPSFDLAVAGGSHLSPFFSGKMRFGGALSQNSKRNRTALNVPLRHRMKPKTTNLSSTSTSKRISESLQKIEAPLNVGQPNLKTIFVHPVDDISWTKFRIMDVKKRVKIDKVHSSTADSVFTFSSPVEKDWVKSNTNLPKPKLKFNFSSRTNVHDSKMPVRCMNTTCEFVNNVPTGKQHSRVWDANTKLSTAAVHVGIDRRQENGFLAALNTPPVSENVFRARKAESDVGIEKVAGDSMQESMEEEKELTVEARKAESDIAIEKVASDSMQESMEEEKELTVDESLAAKEMREGLAAKEMKESPAAKEMRERQVAKEMRERQVAKETRESLAAKEMREGLAAKEMREGLAAKEMRESPAAKEMREGQVAKEMREGLAAKEMREGLAAKEMREGLAAKEMRERQVAKEMREGLEAKEMREGLEAKEMREGLEAKEMREGLAAKEMKESPAAKEMRERQVAKEMRERQVAKEMREGLAAKEMREGLAAKEMREGLAAKEMRESPAAKEIREGQVAKEMREGLAAKEMREGLAAKEMRERQVAKEMREGLEAKEMREGLEAKEREGLEAKERESLEAKRRRKGSTYKSGIGLKTGDVSEKNDTLMEIPRPIIKPKLETLPMSSSDLVFFDLETTGLARTSHIVQLAAVCGDAKFSSYIMPKQPFTPSATEITGLFEEDGVLYHHGKRVNATTISHVLDSFFSFLQGFNNVILVGHNIKVFDCPVLLNALKSCSMLSKMQELVLGFLDTRNLFKITHPNLPSYSQENLSKMLLQCSYNAHDALEDVKMLSNLMSANVSLCDEKHKNATFTFRYALDMFYYHEHKNENHRTLRCLVDERVISESMAEKIAGSGLNYDCLKLAHTRSPDGINVLFTEQCDGGARVTKSKRIIDAVTGFFSSLTAS